MPIARYRAAAGLGLTIGLGLATFGVVVTAANDYGPGVAFVGQVPNTIGTIPASLGYLSLIVLWNGGADSRLKRLLRAVGRLALTNYLAQSIPGVLVLTYWLGDSEEVNRTAILGFVVAVWALQIWWSQMWLNRFRYGPAEWLWRCATYRNLQTMRRIPQPAPDRGPRKRKPFTGHHATPINARARTPLPGGTGRILRRIDRFGASAEPRTA